MTGLEVETLVIVGAGLLIAGVVKGATGLGYASSALPFLVYAVGLRQGIALVLLPAMATNVAVALGNGHLRETARNFAMLYVAMLPGIALGVWLLIGSDPNRVVLLLGVTIVAFSVFSLLRPTLTLPKQLVMPLQAPVGFLNGVLTGLTGSQVMPLVPYVMAVEVEPARVVQAINLGVLLASLVLASTLLASGAVTHAILLASIAAIPPALAGVEIGQRLRRHIPAERFRTLVLLVLILSGLGMLLR